MAACHSERMGHGRLRLGYTSVEAGYRSLTEGREAFQQRSLMLHRVIKHICIRDGTGEI